MGYYEKIGEARYVVIKDFYELLIDSQITTDEFVTMVGEVVEGKNL